MRETILRNRPGGFRCSGIVIKEGKILLMRQVYKGEEFYSLPGGGWELEETLEKGCAREIKEEFDIEVRVGRLIYIVDSVSRMNFVFECEYLGGEIKLGGPEGERMNKEDQYYGEWVDLNNLEKINLTPVESKQALQKYLAEPGVATFFVTHTDK